MAQERHLPATRRHVIGDARPKKRLQYTLVACVRCKLRKIKCSGETPCRQCAKRGGTECVYDRVPTENSTLPLDTRKQRGVAGGLSIPDQILPSHALCPLSKPEALNLLEILREDVETLYPFIDLQEMRNLVDLVYSCTELPRNSTSDTYTARWDDIHDSRNLDFLKILLACALSTTGTGGEDPSQRFVLTAEENHFKRWRSVRADFKDVVISTMLSVYDYRCDNLKLAWRKIGSAAKLCLELGLHRKRDPALEVFPTIAVGWEMKMFWCVYVLDRRYSFMANLPFTLHDSDIDFTLLRPDKSAPYLIPMVTYGRLGAKIITAVPKFGSTYNGIDDNIGTDLGSEIDQWMQTTAVTASSSESFGPLHANLDLKRQHYFKQFCQIRSNQMRLSLYKHSLYTPKSILEHQKFARLAVKVATDNILVLSQSRDESYSNDEAHSLQLRFFLVSSLVSLHLAIRNAPHQFSSALLEYSSGLEILRSMSSSFASEKLWRTIRALENALSNLRLGPVHTWGNHLPPQLNYIMPPISETGSSSRDFMETFRLTPPPELLSMQATHTSLTPCSFEPQGNGDQLLMNEEKMEQDLLQQFPIDDFDLSNFWIASSSENFWNSEAISKVQSNFHSESG